MKHKSIRVPSCLWILLSISCLFCYTIFMTNGIDLLSEPEEKIFPNGNDTRISPSNSANSYLYFKLPFAPSLVLVVFIITYYILMASLELFGYSREDRKREKLLLRNMSAKKEMVVTHTFFQNFDIFTNIAIPLSLILTLINEPELKPFINILVALICLTSVWGILFFLQISSLLGYFTIAMQRIVWVLWQFFILYGIVFLPYVHGLFRFVQESDGNSAKIFSPTVAEHYYNSFVVSLNMIDFTQFRGGTPSFGYFVLLFLHVCYIFVLMILLQNFLIALLSTAVAEVMEHKEVIMLLQKMHIIYLIEFLLAKFSCCFAIWKYFQNKNFHIENGRYYIKRVSRNKKKRHPSHMTSPS